MNTPSNNVIKCTCCNSDVDEEQAYIDPDLKTPVCQSCKSDLRWSQAWMKKAGIVSPNP